ncbi:MAG TPA: hypothetical protein VEJ42_00415 [Streptosporangiaceae bacterium]|nr:hypothetical protein [Streptosporangiaceae bacterium]
MPRTPDSAPPPDAPVPVDNVQPPGNGSGQPPGNGSGGPPGNGSHGPVIQGEVVSEEERAARELAQQNERAAAEHLPLSPYYQEQLRLQLADHAEREHQLRLVRKGYENAPEPLGPGGGITAEVVQAMADAIAEKQLPAPDGSPEHRELLLFGALAAAGLNQEEARVSFVTSRGRLMLDVSTADHDETEPSIRLVRLPGRPERAEQDTAELPQQDSVAPAEQDTADPDPTAPPEDSEPPARYAVVICGSAAAIAGDRPFLGMDALTTYARRAAFRAGGLADPHAARRSMRAAHRIEIVVLLDVSLGGGVWVDVDPRTGRPAATLSIDLKPAGFQFTPLAAA